MNLNGANGTSSRSQWNASPAHVEPEHMTRQESTGAHSQRSNHVSSHDQNRSLRLYSVTSQAQHMSSAMSDVTGRSSPVDGLYTPQHVELHTFDNFPFSGSEDASAGHSNFHRDSINGLSHPSVSLTTGPTFTMYAATEDDAFASLSNGSNNLASHVPVTHDSLVFNNTIIDSPIWNDGSAFLESQRSSPTLPEAWELPPPATNSPLGYSPSLEGVSPGCIQDFPDTVELPPYATSDKAPGKPVAPRPSKVRSDMNARQQLNNRTTETSEEALRFVGRTSQEIDNTARDHPLYQNVTPKADGLYHCPWEGEDSCTHKPEKLKCNYEYDPFQFPFRPSPMLTTSSLLANLSTPI